MDQALYCFVQIITFNTHQNSMGQVLLLLLCLFTYEENEGLREVN